MSEDLILKFIKKNVIMKFLIYDVSRSNSQIQILLEYYNPSN